MRKNTNNKEIKTNIQNEKYCKWQMAMDWLAYHTRDATTKLSFVLYLVNSFDAANAQQQKIWP